MSQNKQAHLYFLVPVFGASMSNDEVRVCLTFRDCSGRSQYRARLQLARCRNRTTHVHALVKQGAHFHFEQAQVCVKRNRLEMFWVLIFVASLM